MSDPIVGDHSVLTRSVVPFNSVTQVVGHKSAGHFTLSASSGFKEIIRSRAAVTIVSSSLTCQVIGPVSSDKTVNAYIGVVPSTILKFPSNAQQVLTIGGSAFATHALVTGSRPVPLVFAPEVAHQIKPQPLIGESPEVVYFVEIIGGSEKDVSLIRVSGSLEVTGVGFVSTW